ncbi:hypothetical protein GE061_011007 [Apolygus lucorum]|uniref:Mitochondrial transcription rescue factor 1 C-terminal domain-containing protein n=1 Tax=Apolygus lucorum TaxID=248454 RepID=A0A8S9XXM5_APOLU|nr:hypothetical protein GE061_011007 [Apolygus lucorum]
MLVVYDYFVETGACMFGKKTVEIGCSLEVEGLQRTSTRAVAFGGQQKRFKYKKRGTKTEEEEDNEDEEEFDDEPGSKVITGYMASLRADLVLKTGLGMARNKIETLFYESKIRLNGSKMNKKSQKVHVGDELDVLKGQSPINENMMVVSRVTILSAKEHDDEDKLVVKMRRYKSLTVDNVE